MANPETFPTRFWQARGIPNRPSSIFNRSIVHRFFVSFSSIFRRFQTSLARLWSELAIDGRKSASQKRAAQSTASTWIRAFCNRFGSIRSSGLVFALHSRLLTAFHRQNGPKGEHFKKRLPSAASRQSKQHADRSSSLSRRAVGSAPHSAEREGESATAQADCEAFASRIRHEFLL